MRRSTFLPSSLTALPSYTQCVPGVIGSHWLLIAVELLKFDTIKSGNCGSTDCSVATAAASVVATTGATVATSVGGSVTSGGTSVAATFGAHAEVNITRNNTTVTSTL